ncbi:MAG TPA: RNA polymerase sigma factor [Planctomycetota bacterium]|nr:RNA polymerase sigma factor [Planctomycetota bacterium]
MTIPLEEKRFMFERMTLPLKGELFRGARALAGNDADALDLIQDAYLRAWRAFPSYREDQRFRPWLFTILRHAHVDACRRKRLRPATADPEVLAETVAAPPAGPLSEDVQAALDGLSPTHHILLVLRDVQGFTYLEMAEILDWPMGSVMSGLHHARKALRARLKPL